MNYDLNRGILNIQYNSLNLPETIRFMAGHTTQNTYDAAGVKRRVLHDTIVNDVEVPESEEEEEDWTSEEEEDEEGDEESSDDNEDSSPEAEGITLITNYCGNIIFENNELKYILNPEGYSAPIGTGFYAVYYTRDHLGNNWKAGDQINNYFPSGMVNPFISQNPEKQPYKFGGKELDEMYGLNTYDQGFRSFGHDIPVTDTMDPKLEKYYAWSPYCQMMCNPVNNMDLRGDTITTTIKTTVTNPDGTTSIQSSTYYYGQDANGNYGFLDSNGNLYSGNDAYVNSLSTALGNLRTGGDVGNALVGDLMTSTNKVEIANRRANGADPAGTYIKWNPSATNGGTDQNGGTSRPTYIGLGHEMAHIQDVWNGTYDASTWVTVTDSNGNNKNISNAEKYATHIENQLRAENGIPLRTHYSPGVTSTQLLHNGSNQSLFYKRTITINGISVQTTPYIYYK
jgi:hypothetical protein